MSIKNLFEQLVNSVSTDDQHANKESQTHRKVPNGLSGGILGGLAAGGIMSLLLSNKKARKFAGSTVKYGGTALAGGVAYKIYKQWQQNQQTRTEESRIINKQTNKQTIIDNDVSEEFQLTLIKAMIMSAKVDGNIDDEEYQKIFRELEKMQLSSDEKSIIFDLLRLPISITEIANGAKDIEQKIEVYLVSCIVINPDHPAERAHLDKLGQLLGLSNTLIKEIEGQAYAAITTAA